MRAVLWRLLHPERTIWPTRDGWWCLFVVVGLGSAAVNTGNNLLYLLVSLLLALIIVSGVLSEQSMRGLRLTGHEPGDVYAGRPALFGATIANRKRRLSSYSVTVEVLGPRETPRVLYVPCLAPGAERLLAWEETLPRRGRHRLAGARVTTRFPFGLFLKAGRPALTTEVIVFPAVRVTGGEARRDLAGAGEAGARRRGRGSDLYNLRGYREGDDPRFIHWRSSARAQALTVRELEAETTEDARLVLVPGESADPDALEAGLSEAASIAVDLLRVGAGLELVGPGVFVPLGRGRGQMRRVLTGLALYGEPAPEPPGPHERREAEGSGAGRRLREIRVRLG